MTFLTFALLVALVVFAPAITLALEGRKRAVNAYLRNANTDITFTYHLYTNVAVITDAVVLGDLTEATFPGYSTTDQGAANWGAPADDGTCATSQTTAPLVWVATGVSGESAHGYYVTDNADGALLWAEPFPAPIDMTSNGKTTTLYAAYQTRTGAPC